MSFGDSEHAKALAEALLGGPALSVALAGQGANSRVYRVEDVTGRVTALKHYPAPTESDPRDRLAIEAAALSFFETNSVGCVPRLVAVDRARFAALLTWIEGEKVDATSDHDFAQALPFIKRVLRLGEASNADSVKVAPRPCLCGAAIVDQICSHETRLAAAADTEPALAAFLRNELTPARAAAVAGARAAARRNRIAFDEPLPRTLHALFQADFGFHNALRGADGRLSFVDFEFFGWDDPVKLISDVLLHPGNRMSPAQRDTLARGVTEVLSERDPAIGARLASYLDIFGIRWALIVLNVFLIPRADPDNSHAKITSNRALRLAQIGKSRSLLQSLNVFQ